MSYLLLMSDIVTGEKEINEDKFKEGEIEGEREDKKEKEEKKEKEDKKEKEKKKETNVIDPNNKKYDAITIKHNYYYNDYSAAIALIKKFIIQNNLIIYGGTAIDFKQNTMIFPAIKITIALILNQLDIVEQLVLFQLVFHIGQREFRGIHGDFQLIQNPGQPADVIFMPVREHNGSNMLLCSSIR